MIDIREHDSASSPAPGDLEIVQRFVNLHDHDDRGRTLDPPPGMVRDFLIQRGLIVPGTPYGAREHREALRLAGALRALALTGEGQAPPPEAAAALDDVSEAAGLHPHFAYGDPVLVPAEGGVTGAFGRLVAIAFLARFEGTLAHLKQCANEGCRALFYDRSKNHSGRWCSMSACGNRAKVRAWRERQRAHGPRAGSDG